LLTLCGNGIKPSKCKHWIGDHREPGERKAEENLDSTVSEETEKCGKTWSEFKRVSGH
jgi:hypothetical protein